MNSEEAARETEMTSEEAFKKWWNELRIVDTRLYSCVELVRMAWTQAQQEGYYQGMTRAAEICIEIGKKPQSHGGLWRMTDGHKCEKAILTERDREEK